MPVTAPNMDFVDCQAICCTFHAGESLAKSKG